MECKKEVLSLSLIHIFVKEMPNWTPALVGGTAVESDYTLYVPFRPQLYKEQLQIRERELSKKH